MNSFSSRRDEANGTPGVRTSDVNEFVQPVAGKRETEAIQSSWGYCKGRVNPRRRGGGEWRLIGNADFEVNPNGTRGRLAPNIQV